MIRAATHADCDALATALAALPLLQRYGTSSSMLGKQLHDAIDRQDWIWVSVETATPNGLIWIMPKAAFGNGAYLRLIALTPERQARGQGSALLATAEAAIAPHARHLFLLVTADNAGARGFYAARGYTETGTLPGYVHPDIDEVIAYKKLR